MPRKSEPLALFLSRLETPTGEMQIITDAQSRIRATDWSDLDDRRTRLLERHYGPAGKGYTLTDAPVPPVIRTAFEAYFAGDLTALDALEVETAGTPFQKDVWAALRKIPAGQTLSYGALAAKLGREKAVRAVGLANGANPIGIVVPCHRVIGADGSLTGYGGGLERKRWLLAHEGVRLELPLGE